MKRSVLILLVLLFQRIITFSQVGIDRAQIAPLAPNVAELSKYIDIPAIPMNGVAPISFSLYDLTVGKLHIPISLSYHASGIKVSQQATWVGLGWNLMPGGNIARNVRGIEDERTDIGWFNHNIPVDTILNSTSYAMLQSWYNNNPDAQPDFFNYSIPSKSGKFLFSREEKKFLAVPYAPVMINRNASVNTYSIIDDDGTRYYFDQKNNFFDDNQRVISYVQSWSLTKIISSDNADTLDLTYTPETEFTQTSFSSVRFRKGESDENLQAFVVDPAQTHSSIVQVRNPILKEINYRDGKITFFANTSRQDGIELASYPKHALDSIVVYKKVNNSYVRTRKIGFTYDYYNVVNGMPAASSRLRLRSYSIYDMAGTNDPQTYTFDYEQTPLPPTTSFSMDYWGYYNGTLNGTTSLLPTIPAAHPELKNFGNLGPANRDASSSHMMAGMLTKITYPTGGYTIFGYEPNQYHSSRIEVVGINFANLTVAGAGRTQFVRKEVNFAGNSPSGALDHHAIINMTFSAFSPNAIDVAQTVTFKDLTTGTVLNTWTSTLFGTEYTKPHTITWDYGYFDTTHTYQIAAVINDLATTNVAINISGAKRDEIKEIKPGGGIRAKTITYYNADNTLQKKTAFRYGSTENGFGNMLMSDETFYANYYTKRLQRRWTGIECGMREGTEIIYTAQASYPTVTFSSGDVVYSVVTQYELGNNDTPNGKTIFNYLIPNDYSFVVNPVAVGGKEYINHTLYEDCLGSKSIYKYNPTDSTYLLIQSMNNEYGTFNFKMIKGAVVYNTVDYYDRNDICYTGPPSHTEFGYSFYNLKLGKYLLTKTTTNQYDDQNGVLQTVTNYSYNSRLLPDSVSSVNSKGLNIITASLYPGDHPSSDPNAAVLNQMVSANMINRPYWKADYQDNTLLRSLTTTFKSGWNGNPLQILPSSATLKTRINGTDYVSDAMNYNAYDTYGNITEQQKTNDVKEVYLWGYNGRYPVAKIVGSDYATAISKVALSQLSSAGSLTDAAVRTLLNSLRTGLPDAHVWTYTYSPLFGLTSETDPAGRTSYYEYDGLGRLQCVKDQNGKIIKMYEYRYKSTQ